jgi:transcription elongation factor
MDKTKAAPYQAGDLINFDNNKNCGVVLSVDSMGGGPSDTIRVINEEGKIVNIRGIQISKRFDSKDFKNR